MNLSINWTATFKNLGMLAGLVTAYQTLSPIVSAAAPVAAPVVTAVSAGVAFVGYLVHAASDYIVKNNLQNVGPK